MALVTIAQLEPDAAAARRLQQALCLLNFLLLDILGDAHARLLPEPLCEIAWVALHARRGLLYTDAFIKVLLHILHAQMYGCGIIRLFKCLNAAGKIHQHAGKQADERLLLANLFAKKDIIFIETTALLPAYPRLHRRLKGKRSDGDYLIAQATQRFMRKGGKIPSRQFL